MASGFLPLIRHLASLDGVATTAELRARGIPGRTLSAAVHHGVALRVRRGWYALPDTDASLRDAVRVGGRLACVSAAAYHGWATPERHGLHVVVHENAARLRRDAPRDLIVHWASPVDRPSRTRLVTDEFETAVQVAHCVAPEFAVAALDSFLAADPRRVDQVEAWVAALPPYVAEALPRREPLCHSFLESIGRVRLERAGIRGEHQVEIAGIGRVDLVLDGRVVIEWDGRTHLDPEQYDVDRRRDALLTSMGYQVLRFNYRLVMEEWHVVIAAVRTALAH
ncbi:DUF559 domain-containing protein [Agromyces larvae]|uniref:DUF559 domain-containing protein n=1 Tax=Agromyces larvae TaxID=2929802 RepID=A0ABY4C1H8_9MICO|nr:DUF559 domain-containing protein [Agromyces larvae]UOE43996.1 DUF559 domain-containing protein [Agromyces larvae]